jgi:hypothetical protein
MKPYLKLWGIYMLGLIAGCVVQRKVEWVPLLIGATVVPLVLYGIYYWFEVRPLARIQAEVEKFQAEMDHWG